MTKVYGDSAHSMSTIKKWAAEFKRGCTSLDNKFRGGRPKKATSPETIKKVNDIMFDHRRVMVSEINEDVGISEKKGANRLVQRIRNAKDLCKMDAAFIEWR